VTKFLRCLPMTGALFVFAALTATPKWGQMSHAHQHRAIVILGIACVLAEVAVLAMTRKRAAAEKAARAGGQPKRQSRRNPRPFGY
jgi:uncharacterized membrane protein